MIEIESLLKVEIRRNAEVAVHPFTDFFKNFDKVEAVKEIFGDKTEEVLNNLKVEFFGRQSYMGVSDEDGHLMVSAYYLNCGDITDLYLDIIHELVHVKQFMDGKELFDNKYRYVERPTEVEAYRITVKEARRIGLSDDRIAEYLKTEWMSQRDIRELSEKLDVKCTTSRRKNRNASTA